MVKLGMVRELTGKQRHRLITYPNYLEILNRGTELSRTRRGTPFAKLTGKL
jgi:hypothetical protein